MAGTIIYTVETSNFTVGGTRYDVSSFGMELVNNKVPVCNVGIAPPGGGKVSVEVLDLKSLQDTYEELNEKSIRLESCSIDIVLKAFSGNGADASDLGTEIHLSDWLLVGVGLSEVNTVSPFSIVCRVAHPAYRLCLRTGFLFNATGHIDIDNHCGIKNPIDASQQAMDAVIEANGLEIDKPFKVYKGSVEMKDVNDINEDISGNIGLTKQDVEAYLMWDSRRFAHASQNLPGASLLQDCAVGMKYALVNAWCEAMERASYWEALVGTICPWFAIEVIPTYDETKLVVSPTLPWKEPTITIKDTFTQSVMFPGCDPDPIYGYGTFTAAGLAPDGGSITFQDASPGESDVQGAMMAFVPKTASKSVGRFIITRPPPWFDVAIHKAAVRERHQGVSTPSDDMADGGGISVPEPPGGGKNEDLEKWDGLLGMHMENLFMTEYRKNVGASITCAFCPKIGGSTVFPGLRATFESGGEGMFSGMIGTVRHYIDCARSMASTTIMLAYCTTDAHASILGSDPTAPYYTATGTLSLD